MAPPPRSFLTVADTAIRWQVTPLDIAGWAIDGEIALSAVLPTVETTDKQIASGIVEIDGADVVALFRREGGSRKPPLVRRFRRSKKSDWEWIARPADGVAVTAADVIILRAEFERCGEAPARAGRTAQARLGRFRRSHCPARARSRHAGEPR